MHGIRIFKQYIASLFYLGSNIFYTSALVRTLDVEDYASYTILFSLIIPISIFSNFGLSGVAAMSDTASPHKDLGRLVYIKSFLVIMVSLAIVCFFWGFSSERYGAGILLLFTLYGIIFGINQFLIETILPLILKQSRILVARVIQASCKIFMVAMMLYFEGESIEFFLIILICSEVAVLALAVYNIDINFIRPSINYIKEILPQVKFLSSSTLLEFVYSRTPIIWVIAFFGSDKEVASFGFLASVTTMILSGLSINSKIELIAVRANKDDEKTIFNHIAKSLWWSQLVGFSCFGAIYFSDILEFVYSDQYSHVFGYAYIVIMLGFLFQFMYLYSPIIYKRNDAANLFKASCLAVICSWFVVAASFYKFELIYFYLVSGLCAKSIFFLRKYGRDKSITNDVIAGVIMLSSFLLFLFLYLIPNGELKDFPNSFFIIIIGILALVLVEKESRLYSRNIVKGIMAR